MDHEEVASSRSRHNSSRSRHGSGRSRHDSGKVRHSSGDVLKRLESEKSPKIKHGRDSPLLVKARVNGLIADDERIALIGGKEENGLCVSPNDTAVLECRENCTANGDCRGTCSMEAMSGTGMSPRKRKLTGGSEKNLQRSGITSSSSAKNTPSKGPSNNKTDVKKSSDSEGDSDNHINGGTDGEDDQQLLIRTKSGNRNATSPHWKSRSRHSSSEGLRKRTRSRSDSEPSEAILSTGGIGDLPGVAPTSKVHKPMSPSKPGLARRRTNSHCEEVSCDNSLIDNKVDKRRGSLGCTLHMCDETTTPTSERQRHKSMDSARLTKSENRIKPLLDNPSFVHRNIEGAEPLPNETDPKHTKSSPLKNSTVPSHTIPSSDHCSNLASPGTDETKMLISDTPACASKPSPKASPRMKLELKLSNVYRPRDDADPPLHILHQDDSFSPPTHNHKDANNKLNGTVKSAVTLNEAVPNGNVWPLQRITDEKNLMNGDCLKTKTIDLKSPESVSEEVQQGKFGKWQQWITLLILLLANLINYMDRVTIAGVLLDIKKYYNISNTQAGLLQTSFICSYMVLSPIFGYLGDRYNRKTIMAAGIAFWSSITLAGSFIPADQFFLFLVMRGLVGVGEASYSTIAPTIIADLFVRDMRTKALAVFYFAIPVGSGLGYIVGANVAKCLGSWQWALRVTPGLGIICVICIIFLVREPARGASEGGTHLGNTTWLADLSYLAKNKSFIFSSLGFTCVAFVAGALSLWAPAYLVYSIRIQGNYSTEAEVSLIFGVITCLAGFIGVGVGSETARRLRKKSLRADPIVCAFGLISCSPFLFLMIVFSKYNTILTWVLIFIGETLLCLNWAIVTDIVLYIVIPTRRSTAEAVQILASHAFGDAGSPYLIGVIADSVKKGMSERGSVAQEFLSLQYSLYVCCFVALIGGAFFLATANYIVEDRARAEKAVRGGQYFTLRGSTAVTGDRDQDEDSDDAMIVVGGQIAINAPNSQEIIT